MAGILPALSNAVAPARRLACDELSRVEARDTVRTPWPWKGSPHFWSHQRRESDQEILIDTESAPTWTPERLNREALAACARCAPKVEMNLPSSSQSGKQRQIELALQMSTIFASLEGEDLQAIASICMLRRLAKGEILFHEGSPYLGFFVVRNGMLKIFRSNPSGKEQVLRMVGAGESFAEAPVGDKKAFPASVQAERPSEVILVPVDHFRDRMLRNPELGLRMLASMASRLRHLVTLVDDLTLKNVEARFSLYLVRLSGKAMPDVGQQVEIPVTWQVLASHLGCTSESLSRLLKFLKNRGTIEVKGHEVTILEPRDLTGFG